MLAPVTEADFGEEELIALNLEAGAPLSGTSSPSSRARPDGVTGYRPSGTLTVALDRDEAELLRRLHEFQRSLGLDARVAHRAGVPARSSRVSPRASSAASARRATTRSPRARSRRRWSSASSAPAASCAASAPVAAL